MIKKYKARLTTVLVASAIWASPVLALEDLSTWDESRDITLNTSATGAAVSDTIVNFPVLIRLGEAEASIIAAADNGNSIRFSKTDNVTQLPYEIESWSPTSAAIWVKVDTILGNNATQKIRMHWGNELAANASNGAAVFGAFNGYVGHWNLGNGTGAAPRPSSMAGAPAAQVRNALPPVTGIIGMADTLSPNGTPNSSDPNGRYIDLGRDESFNNNNYAGFTDFSNGFAYAGWFQPTSNIQFWRALVMAADSLGIVTANGNRTLIMGNRDNDGQISFRWHGDNYNSGPGVFSMNEWRHVAISKAPGNTPVQIYVNGALFATTPTSAGNLPNLVRNGVWIGRSGISTDGYFSGKVDNISMWNQPRSASWFKLSYANQIPANLLTDIGNPVVATAPGVPTNVTAIAGNGQAAVSWSAPVSNGGSAITGYKVTATVDATKSCATTGALTCTVTGLTNGSPYAFVVRAINAVDTSSASALSDTVRPGVLPGWTASRSITLNTTASGANVAGEVRNFPVLVRLGAAESAILSAAKSNGEDIRFLKGDSATIIPHEIESWSPTAAAIWVKVDTVYGNNNTQRIFMVWGNPNASSTSSGAAVFDTANGYRAVFHMNEATGNIADATANDITGTNIGTTTTPGNIGAGRKFAGTNALNSNSSTDRQYIELGNPSALNFAGRITMSSWVRWLNVAPTGQGGTHYRTIINRDGSSPSTETFLRIGHSSGNASQAPYATGKYAAPDIFAQSPQLASAYPDSAVWIHLVGTYDSTGPTERIWRLYRNGVQIATSTDHASAALTTGASMWRLGQGPGNNQTRYFSGDLDEVRIDAVTRDSNYIKLSYENQKATNTLTNVGLPPAPAGIYDGWSKSKEITLNTTASGANVAGEVRNFPVLIRLGSAESTILSEAKAGGADIRFARGDIALPYEIESWSTTAAAIWVKVDTIKGNNATQKITMYWGKNDANSESNGPAVFDSANGFVAVWHMGGAAAAEVNAVGDAGLNAAVTGTLPSQDGLIGKARSYAGTTENYLSVPNSASGKLNFPASADYTLSAWVFSEETTLDNRGILNKGNDQWLIGVYGGSEDKFYDLMTRGNGTWNQAATETITTATGVGVWRHVVGVWKGSGTPQDTGRIYIDGALATTSAFNDLEFDGRDTTANVYIGVLWENGGLARPYHGRIDEVIVSNVFRDSNWVKLAFESQKLTQKFTNIGVTQAPAATAPGAPQSLTAVVSATQQGTVTLTWTAPLNNGGAAITAYTVTAAPSNKTCATTGALTCSITELPAGTHTFTVTATNSAGTSAVSNTASATITALLPGAFAIHMDGSHKPYTFRLPTAAIATTEKLSMTITNIQGKQVWSQTVNPASSKVGEITWNGRTLKGQPVAPGMYIVRLRAEMAGQTLEAVRGSVKQ